MMNDGGCKRILVGCAYDDWKDVRGARRGSSYFIQHSQTQLKLRVVLRHLRPL
jgi:hypothetical protein